MIDIVSSEMSAYLAFMESNSHQTPVAVSSLILQLTSIMIHIGRDFTRIYPERRKRNQITNSTSNRSQNSSKDPYDGLFDKLFSDKNIYFVALERNYMALQAHLYMSLFKVNMNHTLTNDNQHSLCLKK